MRCESVFAECLRRLGGLEWERHNHRRLTECHQVVHAKTTCELLSPDTNPYKQLIILPRLQLEYLGLRRACGVGASKTTDGRTQGRYLKRQVSPDAVFGNDLGIQTFPHAHGPDVLDQLGSYPIRHAQTDGLQRKLRIIDTGMSCFREAPSLGHLMAKGGSAAALDAVSENRGVGDDPHPSGVFLLGGFDIGLGRNAGTTGKYRGSQKQSGYAHSHVLMY
ncbi:hypothetical protein PHLH8_20120 [Pseudomonas sp. Pc102]|nr:hypothetical protein PHLH8_20120 [Pseudomonas sp. Pc102]